MMVQVKRALSVVLLVGSLTVMVQGVAWSEEGAGEEGGPLVEVDEQDLKESDDITLKYEPGKGLRIGDKVTLFGYGELHYNDPIGTSMGDKFDFHRFVIGLGVQFTDWLVFEAEVDFEHAATELELELAFLDFLIVDEFNARTGIVLTPVGFLNVHHEPVLFYSVERPLYNTVVIPTTWFGAGAGFHGHTEFGLNYAVYVMESLDATGFTGSKGLRGGRSKTAEAPASDVAGVARLSYNGLPGLDVGASVWVGGTGQGNPTIGSGLVSIFEGDLRYNIEGLEFTVAGSWIFIRNAAGINAAIQALDPTKPFTDFVASQILGGYGELAYHIFHHAWPNAPFDAVIFGRHERVNTQHKMPTGFAADPKNNIRRTSVGLAVFPIPQVALKVDYDFNRNDAGTGVDQFNAGFAFVY